MTAAALMRILLYGAVDQKGERPIVLQLSNRGDVTPLKQVISRYEKNELWLLSSSNKEHLSHLNGCDPARPSPDY